jgi:hypothetical protein
VGNGIATTCHCHVGCSRVCLVLMRFRARFVRRSSQTLSHSRRGLFMWPTLPTGETNKLHIPYDDFTQTWFTKNKYEEVSSSSFSLRHSEICKISLNAAKLGFVAQLQQVNLDILGMAGASCHSNKISLHICMSTT